MMFLLGRFGLRRISTLASGLALAGLLSLAASPSAAAPSDGAALFANQCASCHGGEPGEAPAKSDLAKKTPDEVVQALTTGAMQYMAAGLSPDDIRAIAVYLTGKQPSATSAPATPPK